jgi:hypothetical protein
MSIIALPGRALSRKLTACEWIARAATSSSPGHAVPRLFPALPPPLARVKLLIPDDWDSEMLSSEQARDLLEILEDRHNAGYS